MTIYKEKTRTVKENPGTGKIINDHIIDEKLIGKAVSLYGRITLHPGCGVPLHKHVGNNEPITSSKVKVCIRMVRSKPR